ncbi:MAG: nickel/cobalt transporter [Pyrinomonadaceae bacterium]
MKGIRPASSRRRANVSLLLAVMLTVGLAGAAIAHPLGNFTINHFSRIEIGDEQIRVRYVVDMAEIPTLQELQTMNESADGSPTNAELNAYLERIVPQYAAGLRVTVDGKLIPLQPATKMISTPTGDGGLPNLRVECDFTGVLPAGLANAAHRLRFEDANHRDRIGWHEIVAAPAEGISVFNTSAFADGVTNELRSYPQDLTAAPLDERVAELQFAAGTAPAGARPIRTRDIRFAAQPNANALRGGETSRDGENRAAAKPRDRFTELIGVEQLTWPVALLGLLVAAFLGGVHSFSPGHGKTVVGAYLVGSRGTAKHAAFLGATVTITHTLGVFALGLVTLFASQYIVPERLLPILSLVSGAIVLVIGLSLFVKRLRSVLGAQANPLQGHSHAHDGHTHDGHTHDRSPHDHAHDHSHDHAHDHSHAQHEAHDHHGDAHGEHTHSHGGSTHSHLPPGADGSPVTWRSLLALGISGGLVPCPSALVVLLSAIALHRVAYGLLLVTAFSFGLAATLMVIGLAFVYAGRWMKNRAGGRGGERLQAWARVVPTASAFVIMCVGAAICYEALTQFGMVSLSALRLGELFANLETPTSSLSTAGVLVFGFGLGLKHAVEADHLAAVSTIVSERKSILSSSLVGGLWGIGHTISLFVVGVIVILLHVKISERVAQGLEFGVALMLVALGINALNKLSSGGKLHAHRHEHGDHLHVHPHLHDGAPEPHRSTHHGLRLGKRPLLIGMVHGLAGSAALMLLVLSTISAPLVGLVYIVIFGIGSIGGMMLMSALVGLPLRLAANSSARANVAMRGLAGLFSLCFGLFMVYEIGFVGNLFR